MTKFASVDVSVRLNAMSRAFVVLIVLPPLYAPCNETDPAEHFVTLSEPSIQRRFPVVVVNPVIVKNESESVLIVTSLVLSGEKVEMPFAVNVCPDGTVAPPLNVASPVTFNALFTVVVPVPAPIFTEVAAPPIFKVVAVVLIKLNVEDPVVMSPPLTARSDAAVTLPVNVEMPSTVKVPFVWIVPLLAIVAPVDP